jgi:hypothetical protein
MIWDGKLSHWTYVLELVAQECISASIQPYSVIPRLHTGAPTYLWLVW